MKSTDKIKIVNVVGARPNFMKIAPLMHEYKKHPKIQPLLVHTGQHYSDEMSQLFFDQLEIPKPDVNLEVGSASHAVQTAEIMKRIEPVLLEFEPDIVLVVGDVNSTIACALVSVKLGIRVAHVEAGLRSFDRKMPEELNRIMTDAISDYLFVTEPSALRNLKKEGISNDRIYFVGNVMVDTLLRNLKKTESSNIIGDLRLNEGCYGIVTLHRPTNVDDPKVLGRLLGVLERIGHTLPLIFPIHPRTYRNISSFGIKKGITMLKEKTDGRNCSIRFIKPIGYLDFLKLMIGARVVLTDSGGIQEETTILGIPCLTLRENTERPITVELGSNILVGTDPNRILSAFERTMIKVNNSLQQPDLWDGLAAERIVRDLLECQRNKTK